MTVPQRRPPVSLTMRRGDIRSAYARPRQTDPLAARPADLRGGGAGRNMQRGGTRVQSDTAIRQPEYRTARAAPGGYFVHPQPGRAGADAGRPVPVSRAVRGAGEGRGGAARADRGTNTQAGGGAVAVDGVRHALADSPPERVPSCVPR